MFRLNMFEEYHTIYDKKTAECFNPINGCTLKDLMEAATDYVNDIVKDYCQSTGDNLKIENIMLIGSRSRGKERENSDIDILVVYEGAIREDFFFNLLNEEEVTLEGVILDFNPIRVERRDAWLKEAEGYLARK